MKDGNRLLRWSHALFVFCAGAVTGWYVQVQKVRLDIDSMWNARMLLSILTFGFLAYFFWILIGRLLATLRNKEMGSYLQGDAYSHIVFFGWDFFKYFEREISFKTFVAAIFAYHILLRIILLFLADYGRLPKFLKFSFSGKAGPRLVVSALIVISTYYMHQRSLAYYWIELQQTEAMRIGTLARCGKKVPAGASIEYEIEIPEDGTVVMAYGLTDEMAAGHGLGKIRSLKIDITWPYSDERERHIVPVKYGAGWSEMKFNQKKKMRRGVGKIKISVYGGLRLPALPWSNPLSRSIFISHPFAIARSDSTRPNVILISIDALRSDHIHSLGYDRPITPVLDSLVQAEISFPNAISAASWTIPSNIAMMESMYPFETSTGISNMKFPRRTLADSFAEDHYLTAAVTDGGWISSETIFVQGFALFYENRCAGPDCKAEKNFGDATELIESWKEHPFFLWIYSNEVHNTTWHPFPQWGECDADNQAENIEAYDAAINATDSALGTFLDDLKEMGLYDNTILMFTADHGNAFGELHNDDSYTPCGHGGTPYNEQIYIPMIIKPQKSKEGSQGKIVTEYVSNIDVAPTLLDLAGIDIPKSFRGLSLASVLEGDSLPQDRRIYSGTSLPDNYSLTFIEGGVKGIYSLHGRNDTSIRFFNLEDDPTETIDTFKGSPDQVQMVESAKEYVKASSERLKSLEESEQPATLSPELAEQIKRLGYIR